MNILITGHEGFIGTELWKKLSTKHDLMGLDIKSGDDILTCDLPHPSVVEMVIHLAGIGGVRESLADPQKYWNNNVEGTKRLLNYYPNARICVAGSSSQYEPHLNMFFDKLLNDKLEYVTHHKRDFIHIEDLCDAIEIIMNSKTVGSLDVGTGVSVSIQDIRPDLPVKLNTVGERKITQANTKQLRDLGFRYKHTVEGFLKERGIK